MKEKILEDVQKNGYSLIPGFFSQVEVNSLKEKLLHLYSQCKTGDQIDLPGLITPDSYSIGKSMRVYPSLYPCFSEFQRFRDPELVELSEEFFGGCSQKGLQVFSSYEYLTEQEAKHLPRNSYMHIDPYHALKFSTYLCDVTAENGALQVIPGTVCIGKRIRDENTVESLLTSDMYTFEKSKYYSSELESKRMFIEAKAGDLLVLDTDIIHCGGLLQKPGLERMTVIYHNRK